MIENRISLFPIHTRSLSFRYRLLEMSISPSPEEKLYEMLLNKARQEVASRIWKDHKDDCTEKWCILTKIGGHPYLAIPADLSLGFSQVSFPAKNRIVQLRESKRVREFRFDNPEDGVEEMAIGWLHDNLRIIMEQHSTTLWNLGNFYLYRDPINSEESRRNTDVFLGFFPKIYKRNKGYSLCVSTGVKYVDAHPLAWYIREGESVKCSPPRRGIYKNGQNWYEIDILDKTGASIRDQMIPGLRDTVLNYIRRQSGNGKGIDLKAINPESPAFEYQYPHNPEVKHFANSAWAHFSFWTNDIRVRSLHHLSKMKPEDRLSRIATFVERHIAGKSSLPIGAECESTVRKFFPLPSLVFGQGKKLAVGNVEAQGQVRLIDWFKWKKTYLNRFGTCAESISLPQHFVVPASIPGSIIDQFKQTLTGTMERLTCGTYGLDSITTYEVPSGPPSLARYYESIESTLKKHELLDNQDATVVLVLPANAPPKLHNHLKALFKVGIRSQFLVESYKGTEQKLGLQDFFEREIGNRGISYRVKANLEGSFKSYVHNIALGILLVNRRWLYRLDEPLHHDITIGVDISNRQVGMSLFDGKTGDLIFDFDFSGKTIRDSRSRREKLPEKVMSKMCYGLLKQGVQTLGLAPRLIVVHRDGRTFESEWAGLRKAIKALQHEGLLSNTVAYGIVEIYKKSVCMPRLVSRVRERTENPQMGSYELINGNEAVLVNTGFPAKLDGTAQPVLVRLAYGNLDFLHVLHDVFALSNLCYAAPDKPQRLPLTLKIIDDFLTPLAYDIESPGYDDEDMEDTVDVDDLGKLDAIGG